jgi:hypothetical protein
MFYHAASDRYLLPYYSFTLGEVQYPSTWLTTVSEAEKLEKGITEVTISGIHLDSLYYINTETLSNGVLTKNSTARTDLDPIKSKLKGQVDAIAGNVRNSYLSQGDHVLREYDQAYDEAVAFKDAGYPAGSVPLSVSCWATASSSTATVAADDIIAAGDAMKLKLNQIREARLIGKANIEAATNVTDLKSSYDAAVSAINTLRNIS